VANEYAQREDLYRHGVPRGVLSAPAQLVASVDPALDVLTCDGHGFSDGTPLVFRAEEGGELPAPLSASTTYYARRLTDSTFQVATASSGGTPVDLTTEGDRVLVSHSIADDADAVLEGMSRLLDSYLPAHAVPLEAPYPALVVRIVATLAAPEVLALAGRASDIVTGTAERTRRELGRLAKGLPIRDAAVTSTENLAIAESAVDVRGWDNEGAIP
jgi:hypothetical protein